MTPNSEKLFNEHEAAEFLNLSVKTLQQWRHLCKPPIYVKFGRSVRYRLGDLQAFITANVISPIG